MQEQARIISPQKIAKKLFCLPGASLDIYRAENSDDILQQELGIVGPATFQSLWSGARRSTRS